MEIEDLKIGWARLEQRLEHMEALAANRHRESRMEKSRRTLRFLSGGQVLQSFLWVGVVAIVAPFWIEHRHVPHFLVAGLVLHAYGVATICASVAQLVLLGRTYYTAPVVLVQRRLAELQRFRALSSLALGLPWWILWVVATMVAANMLFGVDLYAESPGWIHAALGIGVVGMASTVWLARRLARRPPASPTLRRMMDDLAGRSLQRAIQNLDEVARFEHEG